MAAGYTIKELMEYTGHADLQMVNRYVKLLPQPGDAARFPLVGGPALFLGEALLQALQPGQQLGLPDPKVRRNAAQLLGPGPAQGFQEQEHRRPAEPGKPGPGRRCALARGPAPG